MLEQGPLSVRGLMITIWHPDSILNPDSIKKETVELLIWLESHYALQASVKLDKACCLHAGSDVLKDLSSVSSRVTV